MWNWRRIPNRKTIFDSNAIFCQCKEHFRGKFDWNLTESKYNCIGSISFFAIWAMSMHDEQGTKRASIIFKNINFEEPFHVWTEKFPFIFLCIILFLSFCNFNFSSFIFFRSALLCLLFFFALLSISCFLFVSFIFVFYSFYHFEDNGKYSFSSCRPERANANAFISNFRHVEENMALTASLEIRKHTTFKRHQHIYIHTRPHRHTRLPYSSLLIHSCGLVWLLYLFYTWMEIHVHTAYTQWQKFIETIFIFEFVSFHLILLGIWSFAFLANHPPSALACFLICLFLFLFLLHYNTLSTQTMQDVK